MNISRRALLAMAFGEYAAGGLFDTATRIRRIRPSDEPADKSFIESIRRIRSEAGIPAQRILCFTSLDSPGVTDILYRKDIVTQLSPGESLCIACPDNVALSDYTVQSHNGHDSVLVESLEV